MGEKSDQIERHIQQTRNHLSDNFGELEARVKMAVDWRAQCEQRPGAMMALAFGGGVLLSAFLPSARSSHRRSSGGRWTAPRDGNASVALQTWDALKGALVGVATAKLSGFIEDLLPGFKQEFTKARPASGQPTRQDFAHVGADSLGLGAVKARSSNNNPNGSSS